MSGFLGSVGTHMISEKILASVSGLIQTQSQVFIRLIWGSVFWLHRVSCRGAKIKIK